jgi:hypothetical protein
MNTQFRDRTLEMNVLRVVTENQPNIGRRLTVTGWTDGTIWLRGQATTAECHAIKTLAREVEGVTQVFCYMASIREN